MANAFSYLSDNSILIMDEIYKNKNLIKYIHYNSSTPLAQSDVTNKNDVYFKDLFPYCYDNTVPEHEETQLRVFFPTGTVKNRVILDTDVVFQIIMNNKLWLIKNEVDGHMKTKLRPYEILNEIVQTFNGKTIDTVGILSFDNQRFKYYNISKDYCMYEITASMMTL